MEKQWTGQLESWIRETAIEAAFDLCGVAAVGAAAESLQSERFEDWVDSGRAGEMEYLKRRNEAGVLLRSAVQIAMPWARSVVICAVNYNAGGPRSIEPADAGAGWIGRYAWSGKAKVDPAGESPLEDRPFSGVATGLDPTDYHEELLQRLRKVEAALLGRVECETRCYVDTGPLVERSVAARAGVGWIGKNTCVLNQQLGSWLLLAAVVTSLPVGEGAALTQAADRCGSCTRCIDACPTGALVGEREMDAARCIAYLTIEKKGAIPEELREGMGRQVFGCDICQDVCPWNGKASGRSPVAMRQGSIARAELINPALDWLAEMDAAAFKQWFAGSPLERTKRKRLHRNVAIAMGNSGERRFLEQLHVWRQGDDAVLAETADWAASRIERSPGDEAGSTC
ncbi:MAG: ribonuclease [Acidobacteriaceae bacterium]|nr:ribonuclease [Acidobacteriaceae bacterium]